ncbi:S8 family serine peptidase [Deinococcus peraridilitoris]|nr:S8 family serine peptidase [Deinococcus peraridilitoris]
MANTFVYHLEVPVAADDRVLAATLDELRGRADVEYAERDERLTVSKAPNDQDYPEQWNLTAVNMPQAWEVATGSPRSVIAVLDTGILFDPRRPACRHPDLEGKVLPGADFISDPGVSGDGGGRDSDPYDPGGDQPDGSSSYHGTHVAGIAAAATNNALGVAGVNWNARILPVRVLGRNGGVVSDVADALLWAAGIKVLGAPFNPTPAHVINLSVGGQGSACPASLQRAIDTVVNRGVVVVAAAGNSGQDVSGIFPANCSGVISVGATTRGGNRASYSNYGVGLDLMAPGGSESDGVYNLLGDDVYANTDPRFYTYAPVAGTSMAAPHVAALAALLKEQRPGLTPAQVVQRLRNTAIPLTATQCGRVGSSECGAGLIDAARALGQP